MHCHSLSFESMEYQVSLQELRYQFISRTGLSQSLFVRSILCEREELVPNYGLKRPSYGSETDTGYSVTHCLKFGNVHIKSAEPRAVNDVQGKTTLSLA